MATIRRIIKRNAQGRVVNTFKLLSKGVPPIVSSFLAKNSVSNKLVKDDQNGKLQMIKEEI